MNSQQLIAKLKQYPLAVICSLVILVMLGLSFVRSGNLPELNAQYDTLQNEAETVRQNSSNAVDLPANLSELEKLVENVDSRLIDADAITANYRYFLSLGERSNISYVADPPAATYKSSTSLKKYALAEFTNVSIRGQYEDVLNYLYLLRTGDYLLRVDFISISPKTGGKKHEVVANLNIVGLAKQKEEKKK